MHATLSGLLNRKAAIEDLVFGVALAIAAYVSSYRSYVFHSLHPQLSGGTEQERTEASYWLLSAFLILWVAYREANLSIFLREWRKRLFLLVFLTIAVASVAWSVSPVVTAYRAIALVSATWVAAYLGMRCTLEETIRYLSWWIACLVASSFYYAMFDPFQFGVQRFYGPNVWRGVFWNRNHLGSLAALFSIVLLIRLCARNGFRYPVFRGACFLFYLATLFLVFRSHSTTGMLVTLIAHVACLSLVLWIRVHRRMRRLHYGVAIGICLSLVLMFVGNLGQVFGAFNKDSRLSGRTRLWEHLINEVIIDRPLLGHGLGALWGDTEFRQTGAHLIGSEPLIGDSGFIDLLMSLGVIGLMIFLAVFFFAWGRSLSELWRHRTTVNILPPMIMLCALLSNLTFSLLIEIEYFVWSLIVLVLFSRSGGEATSR